VEFLDEEWEGNRAIEGEARMVLAAGYRMSGDANGALREIDTAIRIFEREEQTNARCSALLFAAKVAWQARKTDEARRWVDQGMEASRNSGMKEHLRQFLSLAATLASLRGMHTRAARYRAEVERIGAGKAEAPAKVTVASGGRLVVALANPIVASEPAEINLVEEAEVYSNAYEPLVATDEDGNLMPSLAERWESKDNGSAFHFTLRLDARFHDGHPLTAADVKASFERSARRVCSALPPGFAAIHGVVDFAEKRTDDLAGVIAHAEDRLEIRLKEPLPIYPSLLSDPRMAVTRSSSDVEEGQPLLGTGPFRLRSRDRKTLVFERGTDHWKGVETKVDAVEFRHVSSAAGIASGLRSGEIDLARDLLPGDLEEFLRDPRYRGRVVEVPQKTTYFVLFNSHTSPSGRAEALRRALSGVVNTTDLVWRSLGRFAQPAAGYLPPGILGHDPGRRSQVIGLEKGKELLRSTGLAEPVHLKAAVHPLFQDRDESLFQALIAVWGELGVEISIESSDMESFLRAWTHNDDLDLLMGRWIADYDDPDNFTHTLFNSETGIWRNYFSSAEADEILEKARAETSPSVREGLYRKFERLLLGAAYLIPLHPRGGIPDPAAPRHRLPRGRPEDPRDPAQQRPAPRELLGSGQGGKTCGVPEDPARGQRDHPGADDGTGDQSRSGPGPVRRAGRGAAGHLRDADARRRGGADRPLARRRVQIRGGGPALPVPSPRRRVLPRRPSSHGAGRSLLLRAPAAAPGEPEPLALLVDRWREGDSERGDEHTVRLQHRLGRRVHHRSGAAGLRRSGPDLLQRRGHLAGGYGRVRL
jgi:ABC-type transport system substrate-binding protein